MVQSCCFGVWFGYRVVMQKEARPRIFLYQSVGFLAIIALSWLDEVLGLSTLIFGDHPYIPEFHVSILVMLFTLGVWLLVARATRRALERLRYLEGFLIVCAWCRRIEYHGRWMPLEEFLQQGFDTPTSHGSRPLIASTFRWTSRSMPAIPIAERSAPIVVGISATSRAIRTVWESCVPA